MYFLCTLVILLITKASGSGESHLFKVLFVYLAVFYKIRKTRYPTSVRLEDSESVDSLVRLL
jgi:hypothetical protein